MSVIDSPSAARMRVPATRPDRLSIVRRVLGDNTPAALAYAMVESRWDVAERCIVDGGLDVDAPNPDGQTPIVWAVLSRQIEGVRVFVRLGADMEQSWRGEPLLHLAAMSGDAQIAGYLLQQGVEPNQLDARGFTALHIAAMRGARILANTLLGHGVDPQIVTQPPPDPKRVPAIVRSVAADSEVSPLPQTEFDSSMPEYTAAMRRDVAGKTAMEMWNDATFHPLEYAEVSGTTLDHKSLFHWFVMLETTEPDPEPLPAAVMTEATGELHPGTGKRLKMTHVAPVHRYRATREEVVRCLSQASVNGVDIPASLLRRKLVERVGDSQWVSFFQFSAVVLGTVAVL